MLHLPHKAPRWHSPAIRRLSLFAGCIREPLQTSDPAPCADPANSQPIRRAPLWINMVLTLCLGLFTALGCLQAGAAPIEGGMFAVMGNLPLHPQANGVDSRTLTLQAYDSEFGSCDGATYTVTANGNGVVISSTSGTLDGGGTTITVASNDPGEVVYTATVTYTDPDTNIPGTLTFQTPITYTWPTDLVPLDFTLWAVYGTYQTPAYADGSTSRTLVLQACDEDYNMAAFAPFTVTANPADGVTISPSSGWLDDAGNAFVTVTSRRVGTVSFTATLQWMVDNTLASTATQPATVTFVPAISRNVDEVAGPTLADGYHFRTVQVAVQQGSQPCPGAQVSVTSTPSSGVTITPSSGTALCDGTFAFKVKSTSATTTSLAVTATYAGQTSTKTLSGPSFVTHADEVETLCSTAYGPGNTEPADGVTQRDIYTYGWTTDCDGLYGAPVSVWAPYAPGTQFSPTAGNISDNWDYMCSITSTVPQDTTLVTSVLWNGVVYETESYGPTFLGVDGVSDYSVNLITPDPTGDPVSSCTVQVFTDSSRSTASKWFAYQNDITVPLDREDPSRYLVTGLAAGTTYYFRVITTYESGRTTTGDSTATTTATGASSTITNDGDASASFGINGWGYSGDSDLGEMADANSVVRLEVNWDATEYWGSGGYSFSTAEDDYVQRIVSHGMRPLILLDYGNHNYDATGLTMGIGKEVPYTSAQLAAFRAWAEAVATHYQSLCGSTKIIWEVWNEPGCGSRMYTAFFDTAAAGIRSAPGNSDATVIGPALAGIPMEILEGLMKPALLDGITYPGVLSVCDGLSVHPYRNDAPEQAEEDYAVLHSLLDKYSPNRKIPIIASEWGYSSYAGVISSEEQAQFVARQRLFDLSRQVPLSMWFNWQDAFYVPIVREFGQRRTFAVASEFDDQVPGTAPRGLSVTAFGTMVFENFTIKQKNYRETPGGQLLEETSFPAANDAKLRIEMDTRGEERDDGTVRVQPIYDATSSIDYRVLPDSAQRVGMWFYGNGLGTYISAEFIDANNVTYVSPYNETVPPNSYDINAGISQGNVTNRYGQQTWTGWRWIEATVPQGHTGLKWKSILYIEQGAAIAEGPHTDFEFHSVHVFFNEAVHKDTYTAAATLKAQVGGYLFEHLLPVSAGEFKLLFHNPTTNAWREAAWTTDGTEHTSVLPTNTTIVGMLGDTKTDRSIEPSPRYASFTSAPAYATWKWFKPQDVWDGSATSLTLTNVSSSARSFGVTVTLEGGTTILSWTSPTVGVNNTATVTVPQVTLPAAAQVVAHVYVTTNNVTDEGVVPILVRHSITPVASAFVRNDPALSFTSSAGTVWVRLESQGAEPLTGTYTVQLTDSSGSPISGASTTGDISYATDQTYKVPFSVTSLPYAYGARVVKSGTVVATSPYTVYHSDDAVLCSSDSLSNYSSGTFLFQGYSGSQSHSVSTTSYDERATTANQYHGWNVLVDSSLSVDGACWVGRNSNATRRLVPSTEQSAGPITRIGMWIKGANPNSPSSTVPNLAALYTQVRDSNSAFTHNGQSGIIWQSQFNHPVTWTGWRWVAFDLNAEYAPIDNVPAGTTMTPPLYWQWPIATGSYRDANVKVTEATPLEVPSVYPTGDTIDPVPGQSGSNWMTLDIPQGSDSSGMPPTRTLYVYDNANCTGSPVQTIYIRGTETSHTVTGLGWWNEAHTLLVSHTWGFKVAYQNAAGYTTYSTTFGTVTVPDP